jgi:hypothetical protein
VLMMITIPRSNGLDLDEQTEDGSFLSIGYQVVWLFLSPLTPCLIVYPYENREFIDRGTTLARLGTLQATCIRELSGHVINPLHTLDRKPRKDEALIIDFVYSYVSFWIPYK